MIVQEAVYFNPRIDMTEQGAEGAQQREVGGMTPGGLSLSELTAAIAGRSCGSAAAAVRR